jgi:hypothetical protein
VRSLVELKLQRLTHLRELQAEKERLDRDRLSKMDVFGQIGFEPLCKPRVQQRLAGIPEDELPPLCGQCPQERFLALPDENLDVLYGGAGGGSKSTGMFAYAVRASVNFPGLQTFWFRNSFPELNQSVLRLLARYGYVKKLGARWDGSKYELRFPGGSILTFAHAKNLQEAAALSSAEINLLILDERTTIHPDVVDFLYTRVRSGVIGLPCLGIRSASNPGFVGHGRVKAGWVDATDYGKKEIIDAAGRCRLFIPSKVSDNPYVKDYAKTLEGVEDPELRRRILDGDWSVMPDQAFPDWRPDRITVPAFTIPESWQRYGGLDYGWSAPSVYVAAAKDSDGRLWVYRELSMKQTPEKEQARRILASNAGDRMTCIAADPAMWGKTGSALPPADQMALEGLALSKADNDRLGGKARLHTYLAEGPACSHHRALGQDVCPMLHVLDGAVPDLVRTMSDLPRDKKRPEDVDTNAPDHWYDACFVAGTQIATRRGSVPIERVRVGDEVMTRAGWRRVRDAARTGTDRPVMTLTASDGTELTGTGNHPVYVAGQGFTRLDALRHSDALWTWQDEPTGTGPANVRGLSDAGTADVYNLSVEGEEEYFANGILVHNCRYLVMAIGGVSQFHFPTPTPVVTTLDPNAVDPNAEPRPPAELPKTFGGFPVLDGGSPWG